MTQKTPELAEFALAMSTDGIALYLREDDSWAQLGRANFAGRNVGAQMAALRRIAGLHRPEPWMAYLIIPDDQILWRRFDLPEGATGRMRVTGHLRQVLDGLTPYEVEDLRFDWREKPGLAELAAIAVETMQEAESFAEANGFPPVGLLAQDPEGGFEGAAWFGLSEDAAPDGAAPECTGATLLDLPNTQSQAELEPPEFYPFDPAEAAFPQAHGSEFQQAAEAGAKPTPARLAASLSPNLLRAPDGPVEVPPSIVAAARNSDRQDRRQNRKKFLTHIGIAAAIAIILPVSLASFSDIRQVLQDNSTRLLTELGPAEDRANDTAPVELADIPQGDLAAELPVAQITSSEPVGIAPAAAPKLPELAQQQIAQPPGVTNTSQAVVKPLEPSLNLASAFWTPDPALASTTPSAHLDDVIQPGIDPRQGLDAFALPDLPYFETAKVHFRFTAPQISEPGVEYDRLGFVRPTSEGARDIGGFLVRQGSPPVLPNKRPGTEELEEPPAQIGALDDPLREILPTPRPDNLQDQFERARYGGRSLAELGSLRPQSRPDSVVAAAIAAASAAAAEAAARELAEAKAAEEAAAQVAARQAETAALSAIRPTPRPDGLAKRVTQARNLAKSSTASALQATPKRQEQPTSSRAPSASAPDTKPSKAIGGTVAARATQDNKINLNKVNLLGTFGATSKRRALVRLPTGRVMNVSVGDRVDGGRVAAIGASELRYIKGGRSIVLRMPKG